MGHQAYGMTTPEQRDQAADDSDEAAWQRDCASIVRDREAAERDRRGEAGMRAALQYARLTRRLLDVTGQTPEADQRLLRVVLAHLDEALGNADRDRVAAIRDRRAAAADRRYAAQDRFIKAQHRGQAAIERAQRAPAPRPARQLLTSPQRWATLYARAESARRSAEALAEPAHRPRLRIGVPAPGPQAQLPAGRAGCKGRIRVLPAAVAGLRPAKRRLDAFGLTR